MLTVLRILALLMWPVVILNGLASLRRAGNRQHAATACAYETWMFLLHASEKLLLPRETAR
jgi:hypothetical protein